MKYDYIIIRDKIAGYVKEACFSPNNFYTDTAWQYHIVEVVNHSLSLGEIMDADPEVVELAAYLHDYSSILDIKYAEEHHKHSAEMAENILRQTDFPKTKIKKVADSILCHRGSVVKPRYSVEAKVLASADAMSHFTQLADMFYLSYNIHGYGTKEGAAWLKNKLQRSWEKIMPEGRELIKKDAEIAWHLLNIALK